MCGERYLKRVNVSSIHDFMRCRKRWIFAWHLGRVPRIEAPALVFGKLLHQVFEEHLNGSTMEKALKAVVRSAHLKEKVAATREEEVSWALGAKELEYYVPVLTHWHDTYPIERTLEVEQPFSVTLPNGVDLIGRPDRMVILWNQIYHVQNRGLAAQVPLALYTELGMRNLHELGYAWAMRQKYPEYPYGGTIYNILRKLILQNRQGKDKFKPPFHEVMGQKLIPMLSPRIEEAIQKIVYYTDEMERTVALWESGMTVGDNDLMDGGPNRNYKDPYFEVLLGRHSINDDRYFKNRKDLYPEVTQP